MTDVKKTKSKAVVTGKVKGSSAGDEIEVELIDGELPASMVNKVALIKPQPKK